MRRSLAADDLIILPQKRFFVKHFFEKLLKFSELKSFSSFSVLTGTFERSLVLFKGFLLSFQKSFFCLSAWRSSIIPHHRPDVNTFLLLFSSFFALTEIGFILLYFSDAKPYHLYIGIAAAGRKRA